MTKVVNSKHQPTYLFVLVTVLQDVGSKRLH